MWILFIHTCLLGFNPLHRLRVLYSLNMHVFGSFFRTFGGRVWSLLFTARRICFSLRKAKHISHLFWTEHHVQKCRLVGDICIYMLASWSVCMAWDNLCIYSMKLAYNCFPRFFSNHTHKSLGFVEFCEAQKESKSESELDEMWWKMAGELVAKYYAARDEVEKDVEGGIPMVGQYMTLGMQPWTGCHPYSTWRWQTMFKNVLRFGPL